MSDVRDAKASALSALNESDLDPNPLQQFRVWFEAAVAAGLSLPEAVTLATATADGTPSARMVLLRGYDERGFVFFSNYESRKGPELAANPRAALVFYWDPLARQVRVEGHVELLSAQESDAYFRRRDRESQLSAWASPQSQVIADRSWLERRVQALRREYENRPVPRPPYWGGYRVVPSSIEFWQAQPHRRHDRLRYRLLADGRWQIERLAP